MSRLARIAQRVAETPRPDGPARASIRAAGIDLMGCILAGTRHPVARQTRAALAGLPGPAPLFGTGARCVAPFAALGNAVAGHALDFDDWEEPGNSHPSVVMLPALWALAAERSATGPAVATAYAAGFEVIARLGEALNFQHYNRGWHTTATLGVIGSAAAAARLLALDRGPTCHALSLAISQASGYTCQFGSAAKPLQAGFAARDGLTAALLAEQGLTGRPEVLDGPSGFAALTAEGDGARLDGAIEAMTGRALEDWGILLKPYPSCSYTHRLVDCALALSGRIDPEAVEQIRAELPDFHYAILPYDRPETRTEALFSVPFCIATALLRGSLGLADFAEAARADPALQALMAKVKVAPQAPVRPHLNYDPEQPDRLVVTTLAGETLSAGCSAPKGSPQNPLSLAEVRAKLEALAGPHPPGAVERLMAWDSADDIAAVLAPFGAPP